MITSIKFDIPFWNSTTKEKVDTSKLDPATTVEVQTLQGVNVVLRLMHDGVQVGYSEVALVAGDSLVLGPLP